MKFYICEHCGNIITHAKSSGVPVFCCGQKMKEIIPGSVEASVEKHLPVVTVEGNLVTAVVGSVEHPMVEEHFIQWLVLETETGSQLKYLTPGEKPQVEFVLAEGEKPVAVYGWCNLHGLWKTAL